MPNVVDVGQMTGLLKVVDQAPKAELHVHLAGTLEPETVLRLARRNGHPLGAQSLEQIRATHRFTDLVSFFEIFAVESTVLAGPEDFYDMTWDYLERCCAARVVRTEIAFAPRAFQERGLPLHEMLDPITEAVQAARDMGVSAAILLSIDRARSESDAFALVEECRPWRANIIGLGLAGHEAPHPPRKFHHLFEAARSEGLRLAAHAGEEGPSDYIWQAIDELGVDRIDHGIACLQDEQLTAVLRSRQIPLTVCPISNVALGVARSMKLHPLPTLLEHGINASIHSDDPAYFGGDLRANFRELLVHGLIGRERLFTLLENGLAASWADAETVGRWQADLAALRPRDA